ncbi:S41 family peptidase [Chitinimonas koreensis]|uniref:S41 family peptidase n=1 Tax=Chitinimonas koreensis TaxID=356302 RepID=UPI0003F6FADA|nr:S41 family peptidase [Chitinimonas koreensis]QNM97938.1 S41 family peptidase [Chitinimonas koreensis]
MQAKVQKISLLLAGTGLGALLAVGATALADKDNLSPLPINELRAFTEVYARIKQDYVEPVEDKKLINEAINGMLTGLDPHSAYLDPEAFKDLKVSTSGEFGGLGLEVNQEDGLVRIISPIEDTPAFRAGIKAGDYIMKIDDAPVRGLSLNDAVTKMRGKPNTKVTLTVLRKGETKPLTFELTRAIIKVQSVKSKLIEPNYGYVRLTQFQERSAEDVARALDKLYKDNKAELKGLILDLRNDPGGVLTAAVGVSSIFLPDDALVVYTDGRAGDSKIRLTASRDTYDRGAKDLPAAVKKVPMVVLVNSGSASASEIVAGALQDQKRAVVVGTQTFGKGSVQTILPVGKDAAIKLTTARYFTPAGRSIQAKGIVPDIEVEEATLNGVDVSAFRVREADLEHHLSNPQGEEPKQDARPDAKTDNQPEARLDTAPKTAAKPADKAKPAAKGRDDKDEEPLKPGEISLKKDYQLQQALNVLKVQQVVSRTAALIK